MPAPPSPRQSRAAPVALLVAAGLLALYVGRVGLPGARTAGTVVVAFGDSLTEGTGFADRPWPDVLAARLRARGGDAPSVVNAGVGGNRLLHEGYGPPGLVRFDREVLQRRRVRWVIVLEGINDLGFPGAVEPGAPEVRADQLTGAYRQLADRAHAAGLRIYGGTLTPFEGATGGYFTPGKEAVRQTVNAWLRTSGTFDAVIDFDRAVHDPAHPSRLLPAFDAGDHLHLNDAGHRAMGEAVDLGLFDLASSRG